MRIGKIVAAGALAGLGLVLAGAPKAEAAYTAYLYQDGSNVVGTGSGSLNLVALTIQGTDIGDANASVNPSEGEFALGPVTNSQSVDYYTGFSGPATLGSSSGYLDASTGSGNIISISTGAAELGVPTGYTSGDPLGTSSDTWDSTTLAALGISDGTYVWTWGLGQSADSFTLYVGPLTNAPEPASFALVLSGLFGIGLVRRRFLSR